MDIILHHLNIVHVVVTIILKEAQKQPNIFMYSLNVHKALVRLLSLC